MLSYGIVFVSALLAATFLPFYSEFVMVTYLLKGYSAVGLWCVATLGNTLGAAVNWALGRYLIHFSDKIWFPIKPDKVLTMQTWFQKYGVWSLLLAWLPAVGDALPFIAGTMRVRLGVLLVLAGIGKGLRYAVIIWSALAAHTALQVAH